MDAFLQPVNLQFGDYLITTDKSLLQPELVHEWLSTKSYWAQHIPFETVQRSFDHSFVIGALKDGRQIANARLITDYAVFGYLADVYVAEEHRGRGLSKEMMRVIMEQDWVRQLRRLMLATQDAHGLYEQYGFKELAFPQRIMEVARGNRYPVV